MTIYTQAHLDTLDEALASGVLLVDFGDRKVRYLDYDDMVRARERVYKALRRAAGYDDSGIRKTVLSPLSNL